MALRRKYRKVFAELMPAGLVGISLLLGSSAPGRASQQPQPAASDPSSVSARLAAIRQAVSDVEGAASEHGDDEFQLAWGNWRNGGWRNGGWRNWRNGWHNGGWHNGGWHNGGWHNGGWHNW